MLVLVFTVFMVATVHEDLNMLVLVFTVFMVATVHEDLNMLVLVFMVFMVATVHEDLNMLVLVFTVFMVATVHEDLNMLVLVFVFIITKDRVIDEPLRKRIERRNLYICQMHYRPDQILIRDSRTSVKPGEIPTLNLPIKSIPSSTTSVPRC